MPDDRYLPSPSPAELEACSDVIRVRTGPHDADESGQWHGAHKIVVAGLDAALSLSFREAGKLTHVPLSDRDISIIPAGLPHSFQGDEPANLTTIWIAAGFLRTLAAQHAMDEHVLAGRYAVFDPFLLHFARSMAQQLQHGGTLDRAYLDAAAIVIGQHLLRSYSAAPDNTAAGLPRHKLRRALDFIGHHFRDDIGFQDIAEHVGISPYHFARMFKQATGESPHQFIMRCRIDAAKRMLAESDKAISDIAFEVGYRSQSYFTTRFSMLAGMPPAAYRAQLG
ncbi:MAG TPA: AraC family transcriptional regulator [Pseudoduganella sp.]